MYNKILVPLDGSKRAETIMGHVQEMASRYNASVVLLSVVEPFYDMAASYTGVPSYEFDIDRRLNESRAYLETWQTVLNTLGIQSEIQVAVGSPVRAILDFAERERVDLITMSSHGRTGLQRVFYGSVAAGILHQADIPLLLVRGEDAS